MNEIIIYNHIMVTMPICTITNDETEIKKPCVLFMMLTQY